MKKKLRMRTWLLIYWVLLMGISVLILVFSQKYIMGRLENREKSELQGFVQAAGTNIDHTFSTIDAIIYESFYDSMDLYTVVNGSDSIKISEAYANILYSMENIYAWDDSISALLFYSEGGLKGNSIQVGESGNYSLRQQVLSILEEAGADDSLISRQLNSEGYLTVRQDGVSYLVRVLTIGDSYFAACISENTILEMLSEFSQSSGHQVYLAEADGTLVNSSAVTANLDMYEEGTYVEIEGESFLQIGYLSVSGYYLGLLANRKIIVSQLLDFRIAYAFIVVLMLIFSTAAVLFVHRFLEGALTDLVSDMKEVGRGRWNLERREGTRIEEIEELTNSFYKMVGDIENLKISNYETEIKYQKASMQYLQLQIKPHFYVNALNIIYSMAQTRSYDSIQDMCKALVEYSRYMFSDATKLVSLEKEMEHVKNFMKIQKIRYGFQVNFSESVEGFQNALIPPFSIQTFVENSMKYGFVHQRTLKISVKAEKSDVKNQIRILIRDNGGGYPDDFMKKLETEQMAPEEETRNIGIRNVRERLALIYGTDASLVVQNDCGAVTILEIPYIFTT
ncbi:MAG: histidine kinase [Lachnospiraceae bacterium]|nr:histidine kinase [Lachnospiraceae bacterium]